MDADLTDPPVPVWGPQVSKLCCVNVVYLLITCSEKLNVFLWGSLSDFNIDWLESSPEGLDQSFLHPSQVTSTGDIKLTLTFTDS